MTVDGLAQVRGIEDPGRRGAARELIAEAGLIDLHVDTFIPYRLFGYDIFRRHRGGPFFGHLDLPRIEEAGVSGAMWSITTNILRSPRKRWAAFLQNWGHFQRLVVASGGRMRFVRTVREYEAARAEHVHAVFLSIQGGNALEYAPAGIASLPDPGLLTRMTLVHMTNSVYGVSSCPYFGRRRDNGLTARGREMIAQLNAQRIFTDLAHIHPQGFWEAMEVHDRSLPVIVTHTGAAAVTASWRNLADDQIRAVADSGGVVGVVFHGPYLRRPGGPPDAGMVVEHLEHVLKTGGEDCVAIGSDYDGCIRPPSDLESGEHYPVLVEKMLKRGWTPERVIKVLSVNFLRALQRMRP